MNTLPYKRIFLISLALIALGVTFSTSLKDSVGSIGTVFIAVGGLFFIISMAQKKKWEQENKDPD